MRLCQTFYLCRLVNPYVQPTLYVRAPGEDYEHVHRFDNDDPFFSEVRFLVTIHFPVLYNTFR